MRQQIFFFYLSNVKLSIIIITALDELYNSGVEENLSSAIALGSSLIDGMLFIAQLLLIVKEEIQ